MFLSAVFIGLLISATSQNNENTCFLSSGSPGKCLNSSECLTNKNGDKGNCQEPKICCPIGKVMKKIDGKRLMKTAIKDFGNLSFAVALGYDTKYGTIWKCGGALIEENVVLTAASCMKHPGLSPPVIVKTAIDEEIPIESAVIHPKYNGDEFDLATLMLAKKSMAGKGCITSNKFNGKHVKVVGFGSLDLDNMLHGSIYEEPGVMKVYTVTNENNKFIVQSEGGKCFADQGGVAITRGNKEACPFPIVGVLSEWNDCGESKSNGYFSKVMTA